MNYQKIYDSLILKARTRELEPGFYFERHHVIPRCLGGTDDFTNIVKLTAEEHFLAHQLLVKIYPDSHKLSYAAIMMTKQSNGKRSNNKLYGWLKKQYAETRSSIFYSEEALKNMSEGQRKRFEDPEERRKAGERLKAIPRTKEAIEKQANSMRGRKLSDEHRANLSKAGKASKYASTRSEKMIELNKSRKGQKLSEEEKRKRSESMKAYWAKKREEQCHLISA